MGMTEDFEASLQVLRGFDTDITTEVNEIKVSNVIFLVFQKKEKKMSLTLGKRRGNSIDFSA